MELLKKKLEKISLNHDCCFITIGLCYNNISLNNIIRADEIDILSDAIYINSDNFVLTFDCKTGMEIENIDDEYFISSNNMSLQICLLGA